MIALYSCVIVTKHVAVVVQEKLLDLKRVLEHKIGVCLDELDEYLRDYQFAPDTLMAMVGYFLDEGHPDPSSFEEIVGDVDRFLWRYAEAGSIDADTFVALVKVLYYCILYISLQVAAWHVHSLYEKA